MITIKLPLKIKLGGENESKNDILYETINNIIKDWTKKHPVFENDDFNITWDNFFDVSVKGLINGSDPWLDLYGDIKKIVREFK